MGIPPWQYHDRESDGMKNTRKEAEETLANLQKMIEEARRMNEKTQDHAKGTRMLTKIVAHETARSRKHHDSPVKKDMKKE